ncbi:MAG: DUF962 domain-containing protein [Deltaproteobacteria bacterium]|nr:DUF962 domain-containing protein [Deltaproteobacteria bacterium]MBK8234899.1 DUF962 domain-containing protein [Deltaproteobacteria bacterium]MBK8719782.1 DUF962 domain-containing protein [Deltaproteobacteria bacterium]
MMSRRIESFEEFWPFYIGEHRVPICRGLHYFGTSMATSLALYATYAGAWWLIAVALVLGYGPAWVGHFFIENNKPASFKYPLWSLRADYRMLSFALRGKMAAEVTRLYGSPAPRRDAPLLVPR